MVLRSRGVGEEALDDLVQEVFVVLHRRLPDRNPDVPLTTWITGVARNVAFSYRRSWARRKAAEQKLLEPVAGLGLDDVMERREALCALLRFLDGIAAEQRSVFVLVELLGMRMPEVAKLVAAPLDTLYSRLRSTRRRFRERFESGASHDSCESMPSP